MALKTDKITSNHVKLFTSNHASQINVAKKACVQLETLALITCCDASLKLSNTVYIYTYIYIYNITFYLNKIFNRPLTSPGRRNSLLGQIKLMLN